MDIKNVNILKPNNGENDKILNKFEDNEVPKVPKRKASIYYITRTQPKKNNRIQENINLEDNDGE